MAIISVASPGKFGIIQDRPPAELPPEAWSDGQNVQFLNGVTRSTSDPVTLLSTGTEQYIGAIAGPVTSSGFVSWLLTGTAKIVAMVAEELTDVTRISGDYTGIASARWSGGVLGGVTVLNNSYDIPQYWSAPDILTKLIDLPNWPSTARAGCLRPYKQFLVALDITKAGVRYPTMVKWSHPADPGVAPASWDITDPTKDAGEYPLSETPGPCVDCLPLRDTMVIYKQDSVWAMQYIGGTFVFKFVKLFGDFGIPNRDCAVEYQSGKHFVFTGNDLLVHDGQTVVSVASGKIRERLKSITVAQLQTAYVVQNPSAQEVWLCYRQTTDSVVASDLAIVYNWADQSFSFRSLPNMRFIAAGRLDPPVGGVTTWGTVVGTWADHKEEWGEATIVPALTRMLGVGELVLYWVDALPFSTQKGWVERKYLGFPARANVPPDMSTEKFVTRLWPRFTGTAGTVVYIKLGAADSVAEDIVWDPPQQFIIGQDKFVDCTLTGKVFAFRIDSEATAQWTYSGMDAELVVTGV
jgi:hypothetical protein